MTETTSTVSQGNEISESSATTKATSSVTAESTVQVEQTVETDAATNNQVVVASSSSAETGSQTSLVTPASTAQNQSASTASADTVATATSKTEIAFAPSPSQTETSSVATEPTGTVSVVNVDAQKGSFDVKVTNVSSSKGISKVLVPTWTESGGQDDIIYHTADFQVDGSYKVTVPKSKHKYGTGKYNIHLYYRGTDGSMTYVQETSIDLPASNAKGILSADLVDANKGIFEVTVSNVVGAATIKNIEVAIWSQRDNQDDLTYYTASLQKSGVYQVQIDRKQHNNNVGRYNVELYYNYGDFKDRIASTTVNIPSTRSYTVYLDPGHGGIDSGASYGGVHEKDLALSVANKLKDTLLQRGINVLMTRNADYNVDFLTERSRMANESNADLFVSIHFNASGAGVTTAKGIETYWYQLYDAYPSKINQAKHADPVRLAESEILANKVQSNLISATGAVDRGILRRTFAVLRETAIPAILVELGYMDNPSELQTIKQSSYHDKLAAGLANGIMDWYGAVEGK
ncbi:TPA: N-acetylmuramoyl-L-alanine amidase [Streptococcus suis]